MENSSCRFESAIPTGIMVDVAVGALMSYHGWNGKDDSEAGRKLMEALIELKQQGISKEFVLQLNDSGMSFDKIADYIDIASNSI